MMRYLVSFCLIATSPLLAATYASNGADVGGTLSVQAIHDDAGTVDGDTITIPAGTFDWDDKVTITKAITLQGAGIGSTTVRDAIVGTANMLSVTLAASKTTRITGILFDSAGTRSNQYSIEVFGSNTNGSSIRVDNCKWQNYTGSGGYRMWALTLSDCIGVIDNNVFDYSGGGIALYVFHKNWNGEVNANGSWNDALNFGSSNFLFIENNTFTGHATDGMAAMDGFGGLRVVFRYNTCTRAAIEVHGTDSSSYFRGGRAMEIYNNTFTGATAGNYVTNGRSGTFRIHNNTITGNTGAKFQLSYYRATFPYSIWEAMDGTSEWDKNDAGNPFYSGTASSGGSFTVTVSGTPWTTDQWKGYTIKKLTGTMGPGYSYITGNTNNTLTYLAPTLSALGDLTFEAGDTFEINRVTEALDQPGVGGGTLWTDPNTPTPPTGWNDQTDQPSYEWNNSGDADVDFTSSPYEDLIRVNEHFFNDTTAPGYTTYTYPHPLRGESSGGVEVNGTFSVGTFNVP